MIRLKHFSFVYVTIIFLSCNTSESNQQITNAEKKSSGIVFTDSTKLLFDNIKKSFPYFDLKLDSSAFDINSYSSPLSPDTTGCESFRSSRLFLGKLDNLKAVVQTHGSQKKLYLQCGNLPLWLCNLPPVVKAGDSLIISGLVYNIAGNEKTWGLPTILTKVMVHL